MLLFCSSKEFRLLSKPSFNIKSFQERWREANNKWSKMKLKTTKKIAGVSGIVAFIDVCRWGYWTAKFLGFIQKSCCHNLFMHPFFIVITLVGPTKVSIMKLKCTVLNRMWQHDFMMKQIFLSRLSRLATWVTILDSHGSTLYTVCARDCDPGSQPA